MKIKHFLLALILMSACGCDKNSSGSISRAEFERYKAEQAQRESREINLIEQESTQILEIAKILAHDHGVLK